MNNADRSSQTGVQPENRQSTFSVEELQNWLKENLGGLLEISPADIDISQPFSEYGLSSAEAVSLSGELAELLGCELPPAIVYDYPTIARLAQHLADREVNDEQATRAKPTGERSPMPDPIKADAIAIIGMACRFPGGANTPDAFWQLLRQGKSATTEIPSQRWNIDEYYDPSPETSGKMYTRYGCFLEDLELFDANFFGFSPREAVRMDPQHRLLIEVAWEAMENAGLAVDSLAGSQTGVFIGMMSNYEYTQLQIHRGDGSWVDDPYFGTGSASSMVSGRLAYLFDFRGPTLTVDTACSSSLVALHLACQSLRNNECMLALVGGANTLIWPENVVNACKMGMLSADGRCKTFDASADGFVFGEGCGVVVLKPLAQAIADGNPVLAVIRGSAVNQDGQSNGITAPSKLAQEAVIRQALARAGVAPERISYVEAHGSGTALGDPIEMAALEAVLDVCRSPQQQLMVGAVKTNIGHLAGAAGIAGLMKTVLALQHREIPPHLHLQQLNPQISHLKNVFAIPTELTPWHVGEQTRVAGVSSFGWSGTNAHVVLEEAPLPEGSTASRSRQLLILSARTGEALQTMITNLRTHLQNSPTLSLADLAFTLQVGRKAFAHRYIQVSSTVAEAIEQLENRQGLTTVVGSRVRPIAFLFPGQGAEYRNMDPGLCSEEATFRAEVDRCAELLKPYLKLDLREILYPPEEGLVAAQQQPDQISLVQPAPFVVEPTLHEKESEQAFLLRLLGQLWLCGVPIDWFGLSSGERRARLPLPTYPFERKRYWIEPRQSPGFLLTDSPSSKDGMRTLKKEALADWFYVAGWKSAAPLQMQHTKRTQEKAGWLVFLDRYGIGVKIAEHLQNPDMDSITVQPAQRFARHGATSYSINPIDRADYTLLFKDIQERGKRDWNIIHLWSIGESEQPVEDSLRSGFCSLFTLAQSLGDSDLGQCQLTVISNNVQLVTGNESLCPIHATLTGPCRVLPQEYLNLQCRNIDIVLPPSDSQQEVELIRHLVDEIASMQTEALVALRTNRRWVPSFERIHLESVESQALPLRRGGIYLITGGLGGIGLAVARFLAREYQAKLILVGRSGLPLREHWEQILVAQGADANIARRIRHVRELEALGSEVLVFQADVRSKEQMRLVIAQIQSRFGGLHGVFHTAGVPGIGLTQFKTLEQAREVLGPKVDGTLVLEDVLADTEAELVVLFSSVTAWIGGGPGQIDYSAANAFLGAYAQSQSGKGRQVVAIDWNEWQWNAWEAGLTGFDNEIQSILKENRQKVGITFEEGIEALRRVLATGLTQVVVSTQNFQAMIEESKHLTVASVARQKPTLCPVHKAHTRPELLVSYVPARNEIEQRIVTLWETLLGIAPIGIHDNFFELGGNSLAGIGLIARLRKMFQLETLASYVLYEAPTVSKMAFYIGNGKSDQEVKERLERGEKRRESQKRSAMKTRR